MARSLFVIMHQPITPIGRIIMKHLNLDTHSARPAEASVSSQKVHRSQAHAQGSRLGRRLGHRPYRRLILGLFTFSLMSACGQGDDMGESTSVFYGEGSASAGESLGESLDTAEMGSMGEDPSSPPLDEGPDGALGSAHTLTAGMWDDNVYPEHYQSFAEESRDERLSDLPVHTQIIKIINQEGAPVRGAEVTISSGDETTTLKSIDDGRVLFAPELDGGEGTIEITARLGDDQVNGAFELSATEHKPWVLTLADAASGAAETLEIALVIDATGSMGDEIEFLKAEFAALIERVQLDHPNLNIRLALTHYRDETDDYVTRSSDFTSDLAQFNAALQEVTADGGGDFPEAMGEAMEEVMTLEWSAEENATRLIFIVADAPPQSGRDARVDQAAITARALGARIFPVASSGVDIGAEWVMRQAAAFTLGQYIFLTDDSGVGNSHAEPHIPCYQVRLLQNQLLRVIKSGVSGERVEGEADEVIRSVGFDEAGECIGVTPHKPSDEQLMSDEPRAE